MTAVAKEAPLLSVEEYLRSEVSSEVKHEYLGGHTYAMTGASVTHNLITLNLASALKAHLRGGPCRVFVSDVKVRLKVAEQDVFYYPDVFVACRADERETDYRRFPNTVIEVLSDTTERTDRREKFLAYRTIESLQEYVLVAQDSRHITIFRRDNGWRAEDIEAEAPFLLPSLQFTMSMADVYEGVG
jgi:Uma2 family endonuclease